MTMIACDPRHAAYEAERLAMPSIGPALIASRLAWASVHTGGGCFAWQSRAEGDTAAFVIVDDDAGLGDEDSGEFFVSLNPDGDESGDAWAASAPTMAEAVQLAEEAAGARAFALGFRADAGEAKPAADAAPDPADVERLAVAFVAECKATYSADEIAAIRQRNREYADAAKLGVCATHDFADANMIMLDAFTKTFGREPHVLNGEASEAEHNADATLWGDAWSLACRRDLTLPRAELMAAAISARDMLAAHLGETFGSDQSAWRETVFWDAYSQLCEALK